MPGERSLYRRIQVVLEYANEREHQSLEDFLDYLYRRSPTNFVYYWRDKETDTIRHDYSRNSMKSTVDLCIDLGLILRRNANPTPIGKNAADPRRFPIIMGKQVAKLMSHYEIGIESIIDAIKVIARDSSPKPTTADEIWDKVNSEAIDFVTFKRLMNLLGSCRVISMSQKRIYLPFYAD